MDDHLNVLPITVARNTDDELSQDSLGLANLFARLSLDNCKTSASASCTAADVCNHDTAQAANSKKRRLQDPSVCATEPESERSEKDEPSHWGFSKISLPVSLGAFANKSPGHVLRRCNSDASHPPGTAPGGCFPVTPLHVPSIGGPSSASGLPPRPLGLKRCASGPTKPSPAKRDSRSLSFEQSHCSKSLKELDNRLQEMSQSWTEIIRKFREELQVDKMLSTEKCVGREEECEEAVTVDLTEKGLSIHFRCPCGKGYEFLFAGGECYYKIV